MGQSSGWEPQEEGRSGAQKGEGERGEGVLSQSTIDVSEILKRVQQGEELALADIDKLTSKLRAIRDDTMQRAGME